MRRVVQDAWNEGHPWFEIEQDKFTCAKNWDAAVRRRADDPRGLYVDKPLAELERLFGAMVSVTDQHPEVPRDVFW